MVDGLSATEASICSLLSMWHLHNSALCTVVYCTLHYTALHSAQQCTVVCGMIGTIFMYKMSRGRPRTEQAKENFGELSFVFL